ncbi:TPA: hypothetical protein DEP96_04060 [Candidatus Uhrbacteria bacterium]|nr:hypothetical protein [Candidatus Uhrbacteria bacterium]
MTSTITLNNLRQNAVKVARRVGRGDSFIVTRRAKPLFKLSSINEEEEKWETVIDFTKIRKGGVPAKEVLQMLRSA